MNEDPTVLPTAADPGVEPAAEGHYEDVSAWGLDTAAD